MFEEGKLIEMGTHDELVKIEDGKYAHLFKLQSEGYADLNNDKKKALKTAIAASQPVSGGMPAFGSSSFHNLN
jgi:hypothetical protein